MKPIRHRAVTRVSRAVLLAAMLAGAGQQAHAQFTCSGPDIDHFDPATWNQTTANAVIAIKNQHGAAIQAALDAEDQPALNLALSNYVSALNNAGGSDYVSYYESAPQVTGSINTAAPNLNDVTVSWVNFAITYLSQMPWQFSNLQAADQAGNPARLRDHSRYGKAAAQSYESGLGQAFASEASKAFNYLMSVQGTGQLLDGSTDTSAYGVFGLPYSPGASAGSLAKQLADAVDTYVSSTGTEVREEKTYAWNLLWSVKTEWVTVDFIGGGDWELDNGEAAAAILYGSEVVSSNDWKNSGLAGASWAKGQRLVANWNYNAMSGLALARAYRLSEDSSFLTEAKRAFDIGVLPAQHSTGRWIDPHNARPQYHGIITNALVEYYLALKQSGGADASYADIEVKPRIECALDSISEEVLTFGTVNPTELIYLDGLVFGDRLFGYHHNWTQAMNVTVNFVKDELPSNYAHPAPLASWILSERDKAGTTVPGFEWTVL